MKTLKIGNVTVDRVQEWAGNLFDVASFWPGRSWDAIEGERGWLEPHFLLPKDKMKKGVLQASLHTFLIRTPKHNILVDTCVGNHKTTQQPARLEHDEFRLSGEDRGAGREARRNPLCHVHPSAF